MPQVKRHNKVLGYLEREARQRSIYIILLKISERKSAIDREKMRYRERHLGRKARQSTNDI